MRYFELKYALFVNNKTNEYTCALKKIEMADKFASQEWTWVHEQVAFWVEAINERYMKKGWPVAKAYPSDIAKNNGLINDEFGLKLAKKRLFMRVFSEILCMIELDYKDADRELKRLRDVYFDVHKVKINLKNTIRRLYARAFIEEGDTSAKTVDEAYKEILAVERTREERFGNKHANVRVLVDEDMPTGEDWDDIFDNNRTSIFVVAFDDESITAAAKENNVDKVTVMKIIRRACELSITQDDDEWSDEE